MKNVKFAFKTTVQHDHPHLETEIEYAGVAQSSEGSVWIKCLTATQNLLVHGAPTSNVSEPQCVELAMPITAEDQAWTTGTMGQLLGKCRFHALQEVYRQEKAEQAIREENEFAPERPDLTKPIMPLELSEI